MFVFDLMYKSIFGYMIIKPNFSTIKLSKLIIKLI